MKRILNIFCGLIFGPFIGIFLFAFVMVVGLIFSIAIDGIFQSNFRSFIIDMQPQTLRLVFGIFVLASSLCGGVIGFLNKND